MKAILIFIAALIFAQEFIVVDEDFKYNCGAAVITVLLVCFCFVVVMILCGNAM